MARPQKLDTNAVREALATLDGWKLAEDGKRLAKTFEFRNFVEAFGFMTRCALAAEKLDHHPDWSNSYKTVKVELSTHDAGGLTDLDLDLAGTMNRYAGS